MTRRIYKIPIIALANQPHGKRMTDLPLSAYAVATEKDADGLRHILKEGTLAEVLDFLIESRWGATEDLRIALPDRANKPRSWDGYQINQLLLKQKERNRHKPEN